MPNQFMLEANGLGKSLLDETRTLGPKDIAFIAVLDNCDFAAMVRDERMHNKSDFVSYSVGFALEPAHHIPMFSRNALNYGAVASLKISDFLPSATDMKTMQSIFSNLIASTVVRYGRRWKIALPKLDF